MSSILFLVHLVLFIYALISIIKSSVPLINKIFWAFIVLLFPLVGLIVWFFIGPK